MAKIIKIDRNGSKHYEGLVECDRCSGKGYYVIGVHNMQPVLSPLDGGVCWKCNGAGKVFGKWIERTPEYQAKLDAKREAKLEAKRAEWAAEQARIEAERAAERARREAEEARIAALKAISQHVGQIGDKVEIQATYLRSGSWEQRSFRGFGTDLVFCHSFKDEAGNVFTWKTQKGVSLEPGQPVLVKGTVKQHTEYKDEKQTELTRCKITKA